jgi:polyphosphate kinase
VHKLKRQKYESELRKLQIRLCHLQDWVVSRGLRVIIIFERRDAAGKGGTIRAITEESVQGCFVSGASSDQ